MDASFSSALIIDDSPVAPADLVAVADPEARYDEVIEIDLSALEPMIACPSSPDNVVPVREVAGRPVALSDEPRWIDKLTRSRRVLERTLSAGHPVYGVSTGVGGDSARRVDAAQDDDFAYRIIRQHGCGVGPAFSMVESRAIVLARPDRPVPDGAKLV